MCFVWLLHAAVKCPQQLYCGKMYPLYSYHWSSANDEFGPRAHEEPTWRDCKHRSGSEAQDFCLNQHEFQAELELVDMWSQTYDCTVGEEVGKDHFVSSNIELRERERERETFFSAQVQAKAEKTRKLYCPQYVLLGDEPIVSFFFSHVLWNKTCSTHFCFCFRLLIEIASLNSVVKASLWFFFFHQGMQLNVLRVS